MNFIKGRIENGVFLGADGIHVEASGLPEGPITAGIRPNEVHVGQAGTPLEVLVVEPTGAETQLVLRAGDAELVALARGRVATRPGERVPVSFDKDAVHYFDKVSERRLQSA